MKSFNFTWLFSSVLLISACAPEGSGTALGNVTQNPVYVVLSDDLGDFREDFNAADDKIRLVFISGPSCGICLRGMDDLNRSIVASVQQDPRIHTFVVQVPALDAEEGHAADAVKLMLGPRVSHYWDPGGRTGLLFQESLQIPLYAWDVWMIFEPGPRWESDIPPPPAFWQHQLGPLPEETRLDAEEFAAEVRARLAALPAVAMSEDIPLSDETGEELLRVEQPRGFMISQNHASRGGYKKIKALRAVHFQGETRAGDRVYELNVETRRPFHYRRELSNGAHRSVVSWDGVNLTFEGAPPVLPERLLRDSLPSFDFDGWMTDWKDKGHEVWRLGMKQDTDRLPWVMEAELANGRNWLLHVDSHTGDIYRHILLDDQGEEILSLEFDDFREVKGFRLAHEVRYFDSGNWLATDRYRDIEIELMDDGELARR